VYNQIIRREGTGAFLDTMGVFVASIEMVDAGDRLSNDRVETNISRIPTVSIRVVVSMTVKAEGTDSSNIGDMPHYGRLGNGGNLYPNLCC